MVHLPGANPLVFGPSSRQRHCDGGPLTEAGTVRKRVKSIRPSIALLGCIVVAPFLHAMILFIDASIFSSRCWCVNSTMSVRVYRLFPAY